jgi:hypothetical protein
MGGIMAAPLDVSKVTAVRLGDGWYRDVVDFSFYGDGHHESVTQAGASWTAPGGRRFVVPLRAILAICEGEWPVGSDQDSMRKVVRPNDALQRAIEWLRGALQDNQPRPSRMLLQDAKDAEGISPDTLRKAKETLNVRHFKTGTCKAAIWMWVLDSLAVTEHSSDPEELFDYREAK